MEPIFCTASFAAAEYMLFSSFIAKRAGNVKVWPASFLDMEEVELLVYQP